MKILLLGEYSNLHWTLAQGLICLGHDVTVASDGSKWMDNERHIDLSRKGYDFYNSIKYIYKISKNLHKFQNFDVVQIVNPIFIDMKCDKNRQFYRFLKKKNKKIFLGAYGTDCFWIKACLDHTTFRYSDFYIGDKPTNFPIAEQHRKGWMGTGKQDLNIEIADTCDGIIACLYEYYLPYVNDYGSKLTYIPEPINTIDLKFIQRKASDVVKFFIGIQPTRSQVKGIDILYKVLQEVCNKYPDQTLIKKAESLPYAQYITMMDDSDVLLDQLYSYTPSMNALSAMAKGLVAVSGGEPEGYQALGETENRPVINVLPEENDIFMKLEGIVLNRSAIPDLSLRSRQFVEKHHDYVKVAQQYLDFWSSER